MRILAVTNTVIQHLADKNNINLVNRIIKIISNKEYDKILIIANDATETNLPIIRNLKISFVKSTDIFSTLEQISKNYIEITYFTLMHNGESCLTQDYLKNKRSLKICFLDLASNKKYDNYKYINISNSENDIYCIKSNTGIYKYRNLDNINPLVLHAYELP